MKSTAKINESGWVTIPTQLTDFFTGSEAYVITRGINNCIFIFNMESWKKLSDTLRNLPDGINTRKAQRLLFAMAMEITIDQQAVQMPECYISLLGSESIDFHLIANVPFANIVILKKSNDNEYDVDKNIQLLSSLYNTCKNDNHTEDRP